MSNGPPHFLEPLEEERLRVRVKIELRKRMRGVRNAASEASCSARSSRIVEHLESMPALANARAVALFWPMIERHEVDLRVLDNKLRNRGVRVAYPTIDPETSLMTFRFVDAPSMLQEQGRGFVEPPLYAPEPDATALDGIIVPALAIDPSGQRIGYGRGYYDRTLPRFAPPAETIGVAFDYQLIPEVPATEGDVPVAWIVTDCRVLRASPLLAPADDQASPAASKEGATIGGPAWAQFSRPSSES